MGIVGLRKLIVDVAPQAIKQTKLKNYADLRVAIDTSTSLYQFIYAGIAANNQNGNTGGNITSHLTGTFYRTIRMVCNGISPVYVFDGKPPGMKSEEIEKRTLKRIEAQKVLEKAMEAGDTEEIKKQNLRLLKVNESHINDCKKLLDLMGTPYIQSPCEAEAQCADLVKSGTVDAVGAEDMDALAFGCKLLLRDFTTSESRNIPVKEYDLRKILEKFEINEDQFIDLCILMGCDYCDKIHGIGPKRGIKLIQEHKCIENVLKVIDKKKYLVPANWMYQEARHLFKSPEVTPAINIHLEWNKKIDPEGVLDFMINVNALPEDRIRNGLEKLLNAQKRLSKGRTKESF